MRWGIECMVLILFGLVSEMVVFWKLVVVSLLFCVWVIRFLYVERYLVKVIVLVCLMLGIMRVWVLFGLGRLIVMLRFMCVGVMMDGLLLIFV